MSFDGTPAERAERFISFCDGLEDGGFVAYARVGRVVARDLLAALDQLESERSARRSLQARCELQQTILGRHADEAAQ